MFLTVYEIRGIQDYIFRSNKIKEIVGASKIVQTILIDTLKERCAYDGIELKNDWKSNKIETKEELESFKGAQIAYEGGGNLAVFFSDDMVQKEINKKLSQAIIEKTYSLSLVFASVPCSDSFKDDRKACTKKISDIKNRTPNIVHLATPSVCLTDLNTGLPLAKFTKDPQPHQVSSESFNKINHYKRDGQNEDELDEIIDKKGEDSFLAFIHIDGNNIGTTISDYLKDHPKVGYAEQLEQSRSISSNISKTFNEAFQAAKDQYQKALGGINIPYRIIVDAGDDFTFITTAKYAMKFSKLILTKIYHTSFMDDSKNKFSACAGICYAHSHFPFIRAYEIAEWCTDNAKKLAKKKGLFKGNKDSKKTGSVLDYYLVQNTVQNDLDSIFETMSSKHHLINHPYVIDNQYNQNNKINLNSIVFFENRIKELKDWCKNKDLGRNKIKQLRNLYQIDKDRVQLFCDDIEAKTNILITPYEKIDENEEARYYDACELYDLIDDSDTKGN